MDTKDYCQDDYEFDTHTGRYAVEIADLYKAVRLAWSSATSYYQYEWSELNPSIGQCAVTSLLFNDFFGGKIMRCMVGNDSHYYNVTPDKTVYDFTSLQFGNDFTTLDKDSQAVDRSQLLLNSSTMRRYKLLRKRTLELLYKEG